MLAIVGRPNAGKSSLFNRIVQRERAIVTAAPGTTRDLVTERVSLGGIPVELVDTAGMREASDEAEQIGIRKSREALADADMVLLVLDATAAPGQEELELLATLAQRRALVVVNKSDLARPSAAMEEALGGLGLPVVHTSALSGEGVAELKAEDAGDGGRPHGGDGEWHADQPAPIPGGNGNAGGACGRGCGGRAKHSPRDGAAGSIRSAASSRLAHRRDHQRRHPESDLLHLLHREVRAAAVSKKGLLAQNHFCSASGSLAPGRSSRNNQILASAQSRLTDRGAICSKAPICSTESPPK